ncbi:DNA-binding MarR family transcriptional regulator [Ottowia thiooxydans]|uniref:DNA-binding MarR family transcriptional regulator n=2 Tax=Ottowia thiooxydans TaxID=219182 RepID=A0ABV2Q2Y2_9BURK
MKSRQMKAKTPLTTRPKDAVDAILMQWERERPDLDPSPMGPIGRIKRCAALLDHSLNENFSQFGMSIWEFDVLASLRRAGEPYRLSPTELFSSLMVTSGTMTHRLKRLEGSGLIERVPNESDARSMLVTLSAKGLELVNRAVEVHLERERSILKSLPAGLLAELDAHLSVLLNSLEEHSARVVSSPEK